MVYALPRELFAHLQTLSLSFHNHSQSGDLLTKIAGDNEHAEGHLRRTRFSSSRPYVLTVAGCSPSCSR